MKNQEITIVAKILAKAEKLDLVKAELIKLIEPTHKEEGCINYILQQDNENPNFFIFYENWESMELLEKHLNSSHFKAYSEATEGCIDDFQIHKMTKVS